MWGISQKARLGAGPDERRYAAITAGPLFTGKPREGVDASMLPRRDGRPVRDVRLVVPLPRGEHRLPDRGAQRALCCRPGVPRTKGRRAARRHSTAPGTARPHRVRRGRDLISPGPATLPGPAGPEERVAGFVTAPDPSPDGPPFRASSAPAQPGHWAGENRDQVRICWGPPYSRIPHETAEKSELSNRDPLRK